MIAMKFSMTRHRGRTPGKSTPTEIIELVLFGANTAAADTLRRYYWLGHKVKLAPYGNQ